MFLLIFSLVKVRTDIISILISFRFLSHICFPKETSLKLLLLIMSPDNLQHLSSTVIHTQKIPVVLSLCLPGSPIGALTNSEAVFRLRLT